MDLDNPVKEWFVARIMRNPEYFRDRYIPALEIAIKKAHTEFHQAARPPVEATRLAYMQGRLDGVQLFLDLLGGLKLSETEKPVSPGLMGSILGLGRKNNG